MLIRYCFLLLMLAAQTAFGQCCPFLQPVQVLPANPSATDEVRLVFQAATGNRGVQISGTMARTGNAFSYTGCYYSGFLTQPQVYTDTVRIGRLAPGSYTVSFAGVQSSSPLQCQEIQRNTSSSTFQVRSTLATSTADEGWGVFPSPATGRSLSLLIPSDKVIQRLQLLDAAGRTCVAYAASQLGRQGNQLELGLPLLPPGAYSLRINLANGAPVVQRVLLQ